MVTLDLEGVLVPEIWIAVAERTGIDALRRTTRDEPDYDVLMRGRLALLDDHGLGLSAVSEVIGGLTPLPGAGAAPPGHADAVGPPIGGRRRPDRRLPATPAESEGGGRARRAVAQLSR